MADSFQVYVGYADNLRASGFFPSVWSGSPNVIFSGQDGSTLQIDTGAVRIDNTDTIPITIHNLTVSLNGGANIINLWGDVTLAPGQIGIYDQTAQYNFDSSDFSGNGLPVGGFPGPLDPNNFSGNGNTNLIGGCSSDPAFIIAAGETAYCAGQIPVVSFDENGTPVSFMDSGHIIDTGSWDFVNNSTFGEDGNESINWNTIGGNSRAGTTPEPSSMVFLGTVLLGSVALLRRKMKKQS